jgi:hypothetical protein
MQLILSTRGDAAPSRGTKVFLVIFPVMNMIIDIMVIQPGFG